MLLEHEIRRDDALHVLPVQGMSLLGGLFCRLYSPVYNGAGNVFGVEARVIATCCWSVDQGSQTR